jgi:lysophospholipase L1-like esterase
MIIKPHSTLLMIGDSITDCGRDPSGNPTPWNQSLGLGNGYVALVEAHLAVEYPERSIRVINRGVGGNTCLDIAARWQRDVVDYKPNWVSLMIGINDVWRQFDQPLVAEAHVGLDVYTRTLEGLVSQTKPQVEGLVLMTPFMIEPNRDDPMRRKMDEYRSVVRTLAENSGTIFVDTQAAFDSILRHRHPMSIAWDRIHPGALGHLLLAKAFLAAIDAKE